MKLKKLFWAIMLIFSANIFAADITNSVTFSGYQVLQKNGQPFNDTSWTSSGDTSLLYGDYKVDYDISSLGTINNGDYFTFKITDKLVSTAVTQDLMVNGTKVATVNIDMTTGTATVTFNENAQLIANARGTLYIPIKIPLSNGDNVINFPDGSSVKIIYTKKITSDPAQQNVVTGEILGKVYTGEEVNRTYQEWRVFINRSSQDFQDSQVIIKDNLTSTGNKVSYIPNSFNLYKAVYSDPTNATSYNYTYYNPSISITTDENEFYNKQQQNQEVAFLKITNGGQSFELHLGNKVGNKSYFLQYHTTHPQDGGSVTNNASIIVGDKETLPYENLNGQAPTSPTISREGFASKNPNNTIYADLKDRLLITKFDEDSGASLAGAVFNLTKKDTPSKNYTLTTDNNGLARSEILEAGVYILTETTAPTGYVLDSTPKEVTVVLNQPTRVNIPNTKISATTNTKSFTATKIWKGGTTPRPTITLILQKDGKDYLSAERKQLRNGETTAIWNNLPIINSDNSTPVYTVREAEVDGYKTSYEHNASGTTITNYTYCLREPYTTIGGSLDTNFGISTLRDNTENNTNEWPMIRKGAWIALESNIKGLVITRMTTNEINAIPNPHDGMITYDTDEHCLKLYDGTKWSCFSTPSCPTSN